MMTATSAEADPQPSPISASHNTVSSSIGEQFCSKCGEKINFKTLCVSAADELAGWRYFEIKKLAVKTEIENKKLAAARKLD